MRLREFLKLQSKDNKSLQEGRETGHVDSVGKKIYTLDYSGLENDYEELFSKTPLEEIRNGYYNGTGPAPYKINNGEYIYAFVIMHRFQRVSLLTYLDQYYDEAALNKERKFDDLVEMLYRVILDVLKKDKKKCFYFRNLKDDIREGADYIIMYFGKELDTIEINYERNQMFFSNWSVEGLLEDVVKDSNCKSIQDFINIYYDYFE